MQYSLEKTMLAVILAIDETAILLTLSLHHYNVMY